MTMTKQRHYHYQSAALLVLLASSLGGVTNAFQTPRSSSFIGSGRHNLAVSTPSSQTSPQLQCSILPSIVTNTITKISPPLRNSILIGSAAVLLYKNRNKLNPQNFPASSTSDASFSEPLPDGSLGCPFVGNGSFFTKIGDSETGAGKFYRFQANRSGNPSIFKYAPLGKPSVIVNGMKNVRHVFNQEFKLVKTGTISEGFNEMFGGESLLFCTDQSRHQFLRRLVGQSMTPEQIDYAMPALIQSATEQIDRLKVGEDAVMEEVLTSFTLDVAWRQILGLDLKDDEIDTFYKAVEDWIGGILNPFKTLLPGKRFSKSGKAYGYLISKIEEKLDALKTNGPDGSTLSGMFFAKDEEDPSKTLSKSDIISNSLLLIFAGSETAASTLTCATLALGLNNDVFKKLKEEQLAMMAKHEGTELMTRDMLEKDCPYLDAVLKEIMRIKPLATTGAMRFAQETFVVDGKQIPKGYGVGFNPYLTHSLDPALKEDDGSHMDIVKGFKPERWLDEKTKPTEYMPLGVGPRYCLGANLAMAEMKVFLALFARRVEFDMTNTTVENVEWKKVSIIPKPKDGALISVSSLSDSSSTLVGSTVSA
mmetsp:Transcript_31473/g.66202  ORF Transcript_31473/g.66202 Transcript_31473/m.66202 type:complete len:592 (+) Transcript_31473:165-1940(+)|eukprot:CAMPEP_0172313612 /NCGR_PEP_ID=MMETSP1058-20130122/20583_1 /TAXON_ID=83371 /ORGANISM="Detonula confervacea, Strain CCMP 353" /LENGTH=591 /DNA_ID=CAMNT_0013027295 /DNA_START=10 /DNA_END=1785 /DNA_ORIENTATION=+